MVGHEDEESIECNRTSGDQCEASDQCGAVVCQSLGIGCLITLSGVLDSEELTRLAYPAPNVTARQSQGATRE
jgi:hypothetical protein